MRENPIPSLLTSAKYISQRHRDSPYRMISISMKRMYPRSVVSTVKYNIIWFIAILVRSMEIEILQLFDIRSTKETHVAHHIKWSTGRSNRTWI